MPEGAASVPEAVPEPRTEPTSRPRRPRPRRALLIAAGALLAAGLVFGTVVGNLMDTGSSWTAHREKASSAVLSLPPHYKRLDARTAAGGRIVVYGTGTLRVRLTEWDGATGSPLNEAKTLSVGTSRPQYTRTSFRGNKDAVLLDTTYQQSGVPTRIMALIIRTADGRMYELRVDMPKGTPDEKKGTALFKGARARLALTEK